MKEGMEGDVLAGPADKNDGIDMAAEEATGRDCFSSSSLSDPLSLLLELK
jgi:hypothetical protein